MPTRRQLLLLARRFASLSRDPSRTHASSFRRGSRKRTAHRASTRRHDQVRDRLLKSANALDLAPRKKGRRPCEIWPFFDAIFEARFLSRGAFHPSKSSSIEARTMAVLGCGLSFLSEIAGCPDQHIGNSGGAAGRFTCHLRRRGFSDRAAAFLNLKTSRRSLRSYAMLGGGDKGNIAEVTPKGTG